MLTKEAKTLSSKLVSFGSVFIPLQDAMLGLNFSKMSMSAKILLNDDVIIFDYKITTAKSHMWAGNQQTRHVNRPILLKNIFVEFEDSRIVST